MMISRYHGIASLLVVATSACAPQPVTPPRRDAGAPPFLYVWSQMPASDTSARRGFLAVFDLRHDSPTAGRIVQVLSAGDESRGSHHTEHELAEDGILFANDFGTGRTYRFDLNAPGEPRLLGSFTTAGPFGYPHSYVRLANGNVLATYQWQASSGRPPGGLAELRRDGTVVRWSGAAASGVDSAELTPYSLEVVPALDRVVTTSTSMREDVGVHVQVWRLSDLALLHTLEIPPAPPADATAATQAEHAEHAAHALPGDTAHGGARHRFPGEPRVLADGRTVMFGTFTCGFYRLTGLDGAQPTLTFVRAFPGKDCAVPARVGRWWVQTVPALHALVALDVGDPAAPREVSTLAFDGAVAPHWLAADATGRRLVMDGGSPVDPRLHLATLDGRTGALASDAAVPTVDLSHVDVPGLGVVRGVPHGAVFGPAAPGAP